MQCCVTRVALVTGMQAVEDGGRQEAPELQQGNWPMLCILWRCVAQLRRNLLIR